MRRPASRQKDSQASAAAHPPAIAEGAGHSLATWRAHYDKRGSLRRAALASAAFAALPLGGEAPGAAAAEADPWDSGASSEEEDGGGGGVAPGPAPGGSGRLATPEPPVADEGAGGDSNGQIEPLIAGDLPSGASAAAGAAAGGTSAAAGAVAAGQLQLALVPPAPRRTLQDLQGLWDAAAPRRGRPPKPPKPAAMAAPPRPRLSYRPQAGCDFLTAYEARHLRGRGADALLLACRRLLEGTVDAGWTPERAWGGGLGGHPNTAAMMFALAGGKVEFERCDVPGCANCEAARAARAVTA